MSDYEHRELEQQIHNLERRIEDLAYDIRRLQVDKADAEHYQRITTSEASQNV